MNLNPQIIVVLLWFGGVFVGMKDHNTCVEYVLYVIIEMIYRILFKRGKLYAKKTRIGNCTGDVYDIWNVCTCRGNDSRNAGNGIC